ncbi:MAG: hypothetical protein ACLPTF_25580 [Steroidobacteraceae bacterium]
MSSEWMKVMLDEIASKKAQAAQARAELERRSAEAQDALPSSATTPGVTHGVATPE